MTADQLNWQLKHGVISVDEARVAVDAMNRLRFSLQYRIVTADIGGLIRSRIQVAPYIGDSDDLGPWSNI